MVNYESQKERQLDLNMKFDIVIRLLESSHNPKYKIDMLRRVKQLKYDVFGEFDKYDYKYAEMIKRDKLNKYDYKYAKMRTKNKLNKELGENLD